MDQYLWTEALNDISEILTTIIMVQLINKRSLDYKCYVFVCLFVFPDQMPLAAGQCMRAVARKLEVQRAWAAGDSGIKFI